MNALRFIHIAILIAICSVSHAKPTVSPNVYRADKAADITISLLKNDLGKVTPNKLRLLYIRDDGMKANGKRIVGRKGFDVIPFEFTTETMTIKVPQFHLAGEHEHTFRIAEFAPNIKDKTNWRVLGKVSVYSVKDDLFALRPYKGDFHAHSRESDGTQTPEAVFAYGRRAGHDFMTLSDHRKIAPAIKAVKQIDALKTGMLAMPGEEFHTADSPLHAVGVGASHGVCIWARENQPEFKKLVAEKAKDIPQGNLTPDEHNSVAASEVMFDKVREFGAKQIDFCHPYSKPNERYAFSPNYTKTMLERKKFDAVECPNGTNLQSMMLLLTEARDLALKGISLNYVNVSDTHKAATENLATQFTVVFAKSLDLDSICAAVREGNCVAGIGVEQLKGIRNQYMGPDRLVRYCYFLNNSYYPGHNALVSQQGELMLKELKGDKSPETSGSIQTLREKIAKYNELYWDK